MNIESLFKRFDELADEPERILSLRRVILTYLLHAAVRSPDAISRATALGEAHQSRRRELTQNTGRKELLPIALVMESDLPPSLSDIPTVLFDRLGNIASIEKGLSQIQSTKPGKYPLVVTAETRSSSESFEFEGAAAIIPLVSSTGHGDASLKRLHYQEGRYAVGNILAVVKPICPELLRARFVYEYLSAFKEELLVSRMVGTANVSLTVNKLKEVPVPLVSGPVLSRINELMALCDRLEAMLQERVKRHAALARASLTRFAASPTPENLNFILHPSYHVSPADLRKAILTLAVQGKLVPQDPNDEPVTKLLQRLVTLTARGGKIPKPLTPIDTDALSFQIPRHWEWTQAQDLCRASHIITYGVLKPVWVEVGVPTIRVQDMQNGEIVLDGIGHCSPERAAKFSKTTLETGDIVIAKDGATLGKTAFVPASLAGGNITQHVLRFPVTPEVDRTYVRLVIDAPHGQAWMRGETKGVALPGVNVGDFRRMPVPLPPLAEQRRIVAKVEELMALVDALETQIAAGRASAAKLLSALVAELTGTKSPGQASKPAASGPARRGRPRKST
jgi:type I restriction enzyme, S subunit